MITKGFTSIRPRLQNNSNVSNTACEMGRGPLEAQERTDDSLIAGSYTHTVLTIIRESVPRYTHVPPMLTAEICNKQDEVRVRCGWNAERGVLKRRRQFLGPLAVLGRSSAATFLLSRMSKPSALGALSHHSHKVEAKKRSKGVHI